MLYKPIKVNVPETIHERLKVAIAKENKKAISIKVKLDDGDESAQKHTHSYILTRSHIHTFLRVDRLKSWNVQD